MTRPGLLVALAILALDQASKWYMLFVLDLPTRHHIPLVAVGPFGFDLTMVWNRGVTFGLLAGDGPWTQAVLALLAVVIAGFLLRWMARAENRLTAMALGAVIGGAIGNVIDRLRFGAVADFFDAHAWGWHWYVFNPADAAIVLGVVALVGDALFRPSPRAKGSVP
ncbi:signal peptidase II [Falsiroseomonas selenitidurans]|uniref:Lipoprotein signal peptidase n=1 Tax=Falsiroseomonas selenitidurans TaxID=2716335 RepID=A0ABX1ECV0_9PROT|nr:signal peptidase II [Falsiroseomonas selenitidurans]NKC33717.1 signal peptidase II [Falsiroseomonas selenitidurans]